MSATTMNIRVDSDIKNNAKKIFAELGMDLTTAVNIFLRQSIREHGMPFELKLNVPNDETLEAIKQVNNKEDLSKSFSSISKLIENLNA
mgnify:FL=1